MVRYVKCPRCELNYIDEEKQEYCDVCLAEMKGNKLQFADLDEEEYEEVDAELEQELCPVCGVNALRPGEKMCETCKSKQEFEEDEEVDIENDEEWKNYLEEDDGDLTVDAELQEEIEEEFAEEEEEFSDEDEFFDDDDPLSTLEDDDLDDEDLDDDDYDDDDF
jgi:RecJ-like exonuclease